MEASTNHILQALAQQPKVALAASFDYLMQVGYLFGGWHLARSAQVAQAQLDNGSDRRFYAQKIATALFYAEQILPRTRGHAGAVATAGGALQSYPLDWLEI